MMLWKFPTRKKLTKNPNYYGFTIRRESFMSKRDLIHSAIQILKERVESSTMDLPDVVMIHGKRVVWVHNELYK